MEVRTKGYYDINTDNNDESYWDLYELFTVKNLKQRELFLNSTVCQENVDDIVANILQYNREDVDISIE